MSSQPIVQWNYIVYFHIFRTSFWKRVHNSKEIINTQGLFILTVANVDMTTYPLTKYYYIIEKVYFIYRLFVLFIRTFQFLLLLYTVSWRYKRDYFHISIDILFHLMFQILLTRWGSIRLFYTTFILTIHKRSRFESASPLSSPLFVAMPLDSMETELLNYCWIIADLFP